jgi:nicotinamidase-related amidase
MIPNQTALILIGYQNDYFAQDGILHKFIEESSLVTNIIENTISLLESVKDTPILIISTPIFFTSDYQELVEPTGILKTIKEYGAFLQGKSGSETIVELQRFKEQILEVPGKRGLNAFSNTNLYEILQKHKINDVVILGTVTSICVDSTARYAYELGYNVKMLSDCTSARTVFEQEFYCQNIFPIYAEVMTSKELLQKLQISIKTI